MCYKTENSIKHYMWHHAILTRDKTTTKLRFIYYASAKTKYSLNACLNRGIVIIHGLFQILLRCRLHHKGKAEYWKSISSSRMTKEARYVTKFLWLKAI
jgi:hypothetical protein